VRLGGRVFVAEGRYKGPAPVVQQRELEESTLLLGPGEHAGVPVDTVHAFRNDSDSPTTFLVVAVPAGLEEFLGELATLIDQTPDWPPQDTSALDELNLRFDQLRPRT
jgi:hypothetical protein